MPVVLELIVLMLVAYAAGLAIGWAIWGSEHGQDAARETLSEEENLP
jgi:hypothetical protein